MKDTIIVSEYLREDFVIDLQSNDKEGALEELLDVITRSDKITDPAIFRRAIHNREKLMSTGIGYEVAVPHARDKSVTDFVIAVGRKTSGLDYPSIDDKPVKLVFMIGASDRQDKDYIKLLSRLVLRLKNPQFKSEIMAADSSHQIYEIITKTQ